LNTNVGASLSGEHDILLHTKQNWVVETYVKKQAYGEEILSQTQKLSNFEMKCLLLEMTNSEGIVFNLHETVA
jgi:hypothetical protein